MNQFLLVVSSLARKERTYIIHRIIKEYTGIYVYHCLPLLGNYTFIQIWEFKLSQLVLRDNFCDDVYYCIGLET